MTHAHVTFGIFGIFGTFDIFVAFFIHVPNASASEVHTS